MLFRQLSTMRDEILNWTSDAKETISEALLHPGELELMTMKLNKIRQEWPTYSSIQNSIRTKMAKLCELNQGVLPESVDSVQQLIKCEMDATKDCCDRLEASINKIHQQEEGLHKDLRDMSTRISDFKTKLKPCEDLMATDDRLAEQFKTVSEVQVEYNMAQTLLQPLLERCQKLQDQCGPACETLPLTKELRSVQKQNTNVGVLLKKLSSGIKDTLNKRFNERITNIQRVCSCNSNTEIHQPFPNEK